MRSTIPFALCGLVLASGPAMAAPAAAELRLVPFPKEVILGEGAFGPPAGGSLVLTLPAGEGLATAAAALRREIEAVVPRPVRFSVRETPAAPPVLWFSLDDGTRPLPPDPLPPPPDQGWGEGYALRAAPDRVAGAATALPGLANALRTLTQLFRANAVEGAVPAVAVRDWPSLRYRGYQDDLTRGPSSKPSFLLEELDLGAALKMNLFTYYMEHQFAFARHPVIGLPEENGALGPGELRALVGQAAARHIHVLGCQQSFGHFWNILRHKEYEHLRETPGILDPTNEDTCRLLDDLYAEQAPLLPFPMFNVCCDETDGLGTGPSATLAAEIGVGGVYARHLARLHDILARKYNKRMMMWGDIILRHPDHLREIPSDTIMLTWGYGPRPSFTDQIEPFARSGFEFFVCPGVNGWSRILPDFGAATVNIRNFLRDGVAQGALGTINTTWDDDGENLGGAHWHGFAWGAECAWNGGATAPEDFNRRVGAVLFGEAGDHFGQAVTLLGKAHALPGLDSLLNRRFWELDTAACPVSEPATRAQAAAILAVVEPALAHLRALRAEARADHHAVEVMEFGAERLRLIAERMTAVLDCARTAERAVRGELGPAEARTRALEPLRALRDRHAALRKVYEALWNHENEPYALERVLERYDALLKRYDAMIARLEAVLAALDANAAAGPEGPRAPLPSLAEAGLAVRELGVRSVHPEGMDAAALGGALPWPVQAVSRLGLSVRWPDGVPDGVPVPVQVAIPPAAVPEGCVPVLMRLETGAEPAAQNPVPCQLDLLQGETVLTFLAARTGAEPEEPCLLYAAPAGTDPAPVPGGVALTREPEGRIRLRNGRVELLIGPVGGHIEEWRVAAAGGVDLTHTGPESWAGFADLGGDLRDAVHALEVVRSGPVAAQVRAAAPQGFTKDILLCAGQGWAEVTLNSPAGWYWDYGNAEPFAPGGAMPGTFLFSDGSQGATGPVSAGLAAQVRRDRVLWGARTRADGLTHALLTPGVRTAHMTGPGAGWGGCGLENAPPTAHFVTVGDVLEPGRTGERLDALAGALSLAAQPRVTLHALEKRK